MRTRTWRTFVVAFITSLLMQVSIAEAGSIEEVRLKRKRAPGISHRTMRTATAKVKVKTRLKAKPARIAKKQRQRAVTRRTASLRTKRRSSQVRYSASPHAHPAFQRRDYLGANRPMPAPVTRTPAASTVPRVTAAAAPSYAAPVSLPASKPIPLVTKSGNYRLDMTQRDYRHMR